MAEIGDLTLAAARGDPAAIAERNARSDDFTQRVPESPPFIEEAWDAGHGKSPAAAIRSYGLDRPQLINRMASFEMGSFGGGARWELTFLELRIVERPENGGFCRARYAPEVAPPADHGGRD